MKKILLVILLLASLKSFAQQDVLLRFDKRFIDCENKWVAIFPKKGDTSITYGFVYIDPQAGLTFDYAGKFKVDSGKLFPVYKVPQDSTSIKIRLQASNTAVAIIPNERLNDLAVEEFPDRFKNYQTSDTNSATYLYRRGFLYNDWNESDKALPYLEKGNEKYPDDAHIQFELAFAYNALQNYDKAIPLLETMIKAAPLNGNLYKELSYAQLETNHLSEAAETAKKGIPLENAADMKSEMAYNLAHHYYLIKDKSNFDYWDKEARKYATEGDAISLSLNALEEKINQ